MKAIDLIAVYGEGATAEARKAEKRGRAARRPVDVRLWAEVGREIARRRDDAAATEHPT